MDKTGALVPFLFTVHKGQTEIFDITASTNKCTCQWDATIELTVNGKQERYTVRAAGNAPFKTTSSLDAKPYQWIDGRWADQSNDLPSPPTVTPAPQDLPGPVPDICKLAAPEATSILPKPVRTKPDANSVQTGAAGALLRHSGCTFVVNVPTPKHVPSTGVLLDSISTWVDGAKTDTLAKAEMEALVKGYSTNGPGRKLPELSSDAFLFEGVFVAQTGRMIVTVQVSSSREGLTKRTLVIGRTIFEKGVALLE
jgi:hypothetical protein